MERHHLPNSTSISTVLYDSNTQVMDIEFRQGEVYRFYLVPRQVVSSLIDAESPGKNFREEVRDHYPFTRLR